MKYPKNYRLHHFHFGGKAFSIAAMAGPHNNTSSEGNNMTMAEALQFLKDNQREILIGLHEDIDFTEDAHRYGLRYHYFPIDDYSKEPIACKLYDTIFNIVMTAAANKQLVAIHCGSGDGRTGTLLAAFKLREIIEKAFKDNKENPTCYIENQEAKLDATVKPSEDFEMACTPFVKAAVEAVRTEVEPLRGDGLASVERANDVQTLLNYEKHLFELHKTASLSKLKRKLEEPLSPRQNKAKTKPQLKSETEPQLKSKTEKGSPKV